MKTIIAGLLLLLSATCASAEWRVVIDRNMPPTGNCPWLVVNGRTEYLATSNRAYAQAVADEMNRRQLGPCWWYGVRSQKALDTHDAITDRAWQTINNRAIYANRK